MVLELVGTLGDVLLNLVHMQLHQALAQPPLCIVVHILECPVLSENIIIVTAPTQPQHNLN